MVWCHNANLLTLKKRYTVERRRAHAMAARASSAPSLTGQCTRVLVPLTSTHLSHERERQVKHRGGHTRCTPRVVSSARGCTGSGTSRNARGPARRKQDARRQRAGRSSQIAACRGRSHGSTIFCDRRECACLARESGAPQRTL